MAPKKTIVLTIATPQKGTLNFRKPPFVEISQRQAIWAMAEHNFEIEVGLGLNMQPPRNKEISL